MVGVKNVMCKGSGFFRVYRSVDGDMKESAQRVGGGVVERAWRSLGGMVM